METICGVVERILFQNPENGYAVIELCDDDDRHIVTGLMPLIAAGETLEGKGKLTVHNQYGEQIALESCRRSLPSTVEQIFAFLSDGNVKGIGAATAMQIINAFGEDSFEVLMSDPERLSQIRGITFEKAQELSVCFCEDMNRRSVILTYMDMGIDPTHAFLAWETWGFEAIDKLQNPYDLCEEPVGLSFEQADEIARNCEIPVDDICRLRAGILYVLKHNAANEGHSCLPLDKLTVVAAGRLTLDPELVTDTIEDMCDEGALIKRNFSNREFVFLARLYNAERYVAERLKLLSGEIFPCPFDVEEEIAALEEKLHIEFEEKQKQAIAQAATTGALVLTGGPGTGKTTTTRAIIKLLARQGHKIKVCAPTGRAARRLSELSGRKARTIHKLLEVKTFRGESVFVRNENNMLECDAIIIDEISMVDITLFNALLKALKPSCRVILVGDKNQLPSIGAGNILKDVLESGTVNSVELVHIFRQAMQSLIVTNAHKINQGDMPDLSVKDNDFFFLKSPAKAQGVETVIGLYTRRLPASYGYSPLEDIQVLAPNKQGEAGTIELNNRIQNAINPPATNKNEMKGVLYTFREGDKVMQVRNNYSIRCLSEDKDTTSVFNGDMGVIDRIDRHAGLMYVSFDNEMALYSQEESMEIELAYAVTVHKSQGSEYEAVIIPMFEGPKRLYFRKLLYTGVTRAKSLLILVGQQHIIEQMVRNNLQNNRYTALGHFLTGETGGEDF